MNVKFYFGTQAKYDALAEKNPIALYFIEDTQRLYKGDVLMATGADASSMAAGLMSSEDKMKLDELKNMELVAVDGTIKLADIENGKSIGVAISAQEGNTLVAVEDGLFVPVAKEIAIPEYEIEKQEVAEDGYSTSYKLKKTVNGESTYVGDAINIGKDMVLQSATLETVVEANVPYEGAVIGDPYIDMAFNDAEASHIYIPVSGLVDTYTAGEGIKIVDGKISIKLTSESNGLYFVDGALSLALATKNTAGALSPVDKAFIDSIPDVFATKGMVKDTAIQKKFEVLSVPKGTLVNYGEREIRVMCPANTEFVKQQVGVGGDANTYYMTFRTYAPNDNAVGYIEHLGDQVDSEVLTNLATDKYGRKYQSTWLGIAKYDEATGKWTYYGSNSSDDKYIGWDYQIDWYDADGVMIESDSIRINLSNENCHNVVKPYYMSGYATVNQIETLQEAYSWGEL